MSAQTEPGLTWGKITAPQQPVETGGEVAVQPEEHKGDEAETLPAEPVVYEEGTGGKVAVQPEEHKGDEAETLPAGEECTCDPEEHKEDEECTCARSRQEGAIKPAPAQPAGAKEAGPEKKASLFDIKQYSEDSFQYSEGEYSRTTAEDFDFGETGSCEYEPFQEFIFTDSALDLPFDEEVESVKLDSKEMLFMNEFPALCKMEPGKRVEPAAASKGPPQEQVPGEPQVSEEVGGGEAAEEPQVPEEVTEGRAAEEPQVPEEVAEGEAAEKPQVSEEVTEGEAAEGPQEVTEGEAAEPQEVTEGEAAEEPEEVTEGEAAEEPQEVTEGEAAEPQEVTEGEAAEEPQEVTEGEAAEEPQISEEAPEQLMLDLKEEAAVREEKTVIPVPKPIGEEVSRISAKAQAGYRIEKVTSSTSPCADEFSIIKHRVGRQVESELINAVEEEVLGGGVISEKPEGKPEDTEGVPPEPIIYEEKEDIPPAPEEGESIAKAGEVQEEITEQGDVIESPEEEVAVDEDITQPSEEAAKEEIPKGEEEAIEEDLEKPAVEKELEVSGEEGEEEEPEGRMLEVEDEATDEGEFEPQEPEGVTESETEEVPQEVTEGEAAEEPQEVTEGEAAEEPQEVTEGEAAEEPQEVTEGEAAEEPQEVTEGEAAEEPEEVTEGEAAEEPQEVTEGEAAEPQEVTEGEAAEEPQEVTEGEAAEEPQITEEVTEGELVEQPQITEEVTREEVVEEPDVSDEVAESEAAEEPQEVTEGEAAEPQEVTEGEAAEEPQEVTEGEAAEEPQITEEVTEGELVEQPQITEEVTREEVVEEPDLSDEVAESEAAGEPQISEEVAEGEAAEEPDISAEVAEGEAAEEPEVSGEVTEGEAAEEPDISAEVREGETEEEVQIAPDITEDETMKEPEISEEIAGGETVEEPHVEELPADEPIQPKEEISAPPEEVQLVVKSVERPPERAIIGTSSSDIKQQIMILQERMKKKSEEYMDLRNLVMQVAGGKQPVGGSGGVQAGAPCTDVSICPCPSSEPKYGAVKPVASTLSDLHYAIEALHSKCRMKDHMIATLLDELRLYSSDSEKFNKILQSVASAPSGPAKYDFDRGRMCDFLTRPERLEAPQQHLPGDPASSGPSSSGRGRDVMPCNRCGRQESYSDINDLTPQMKVFCQCNQGSSSPPPCPRQSGQPSKPAEGRCACPSDFKILRRVGHDSLLISWKIPPIDKITGYEIFVNGILKLCVKSPTRNKALVPTLNLHEKLVIFLYAVTEEGRASKPVIAVYQKPPGGDDTMYCYPQ